MTPQASLKTLAFIANKQQLSYLISPQMAELHGDIHIICLNPMTEYHAGKMGLKYSSIESYYNPAELMRIASEGYESCERFAEYLDREINISFNNVCTQGYFSSTFFIFLLKTFYDTAFSKLYILLAVIEAFSPSKVICFKDDNTISYYYQDYYLGDLNYKILELLKSRFEFELFSYKLPVPKGKTTRVFSIIKTLKKIPLGIMVRTWLMLKRAISSARYVVHRNPGLATISMGQDNTLAVLGDYVSGWQEMGGKVVSLAKTITDTDFSFQDIDRSALLVKFGIATAALENFLQGLRSKLEFTRWFEYRSINFSTVTVPWLKQFICLIFPKCILAGEVIENKIKECGASAFLTPAFCNTNEVATILACKRLGVKVCSVQHGSGALLNLPMIEYVEFRNIDYSLVFGPGAANHARQHYHIESKEGIAQPVTVGNPYLYSLFNKNRNRPRLSPGKQRRILYILTHLIPDFYYYGWNCYPNNWYSQLQRRVLDTIKNFPEVTLYVKQYQAAPIEDPLREYVVDQNISNVEFLPNIKDMSRYLDKADLFLIDFPSTSLLKMLCTRKPVIVYWNPEYLKMPLDVQQTLKKRVDLCFTVEELIAVISKFCKLPSLPELENPDDSYFAYFNLGKQGVEPKKQVAEFLLSCISRQGASSK